MKYTDQHLEFYQFILERNSVLLSELIEHFSGNNVENIHEILAELQDQELVVFDTEKVSALPPYVASSKLNTDQDRRALEFKLSQKENTEAFQTLLNKYEKHFSTVQTKLEYKSLLTEDETRELCLKLAQKATKSLKIITIPPGFGADKLSIAFPHILKSLHSGLNIQRIITDNSYSAEQLEQLQEIFGHVNFQLRTADVVDFQIMIVDDKYTLVAETSFPHSGKAYYFTDPGIAALMGHIFVARWKEATEVSSQEIIELPENIERTQIFKLLFDEGMSDKEIRQQLGLSEKVFRKRMHDYAQSIDAHNRDQLAAYAFQHGWHL